MYGQDILQQLGMDRTHLRLQCEREIKTKQIGLRQGYVSSLGKEGASDRLSLIRSFTGSMPLFRAVILLLGKEPPGARTEVISVFTAAAAIQTGPFTKMLPLKAGRHQTFRTGASELVRTLLSLHSRP